MPTPRELRLAVQARLDSVPGLYILKDADDEAPVGPDGLIGPYAAFYPGTPGRPDPGEESLCGDLGHGVWTFQVTCAGQRIDHAEWALTRVLGVLTPKVRLAPDTGFVRQEYVPTFATEDTETSPHRWYYPLIFTVHIP